MFQTSVQKEAAGILFVPKSVFHFPFKWRANQSYTKGMGRGLDEEEEEEEEEAAIALRCEEGKEGGEEAAGLFPPSSFSPPPLPRRYKRRGWPPSSLQHFVRCGGGGNGQRSRPRGRSEGAFQKRKRSNPAQKGI